MTCCKMTTYELASLATRLDYSDEALRLKLLRYATDMCHEIPRLPNQSDWDSRYFCGTKFHGPIIYQQHGVFIKTVQGVKACLILLGIS